MKYLAVILSFLILIPSVLICADELSCIEEKKECTSGEHDQEEEHDCAPCWCVCCGLNLNISVISVFEDFLPPLNDLDQILFSFLYSFSFINLIWHPPAY